MNKIFLSLLFVAAGAVCLSAADKTAAGGEPDFSSFVWPVESGAYKPGAGAELAQSLCITCHSTEYVSTQPPLPRKFWEATVKKMKEKYAAPLPADNTALIDYLTSAYGAK
jgi:sulfite dehydrogenase (cytochrome) subunit B